MNNSRRRHRSRTLTSEEQPQATTDQADSSSPSVEEEPAETQSIEDLDFQFAGPLRRFYAFALDIGILLMVVFVASPVFGSTKGVFDVPSIQTGIIDVFIFLAYFIVPTGIYGRTIGKWVAGISVVDDEGKKPGVALAIPREMVGRFVATVTFGIGIIWVIFDKNHQGWHDKIAGTYVVVIPNSGGPGFLARMFAPQEEKSNETRTSRVGRPTTRRRRNRRRN